MSECLKEMILNRWTIAYSLRETKVHTYPLSTKDGFLIFYNTTRTIQPDEVHFS